MKSVKRPAPDQILVEIADYVTDFPVESSLALLPNGSLVFAFQALDHPACRKVLVPVVPAAVLPNVARVPGTAWELDPVTAAFNIGAMIRWLDFNDTWLAAEWDIRPTVSPRSSPWRIIGVAATGRA
jgi:2-methylcitrate dehydratase